MLLALLLALPWTAARAADPLGEGRRAWKEGRWAEARTLLGEALVGPTRAEALPLLGELALLTGQIDEASRLAGEADLVPGLEAPAALLRGRALRESGRHEEALRAFAEATRIDPEFGKARVEQGELLLYLGRKDAGRRLLEPLVARDDLRAHTSVADLLTFGRAALLLGKVKMAFSAFDQATVQQPGSVEAQLRLAWTALSKDDVRHAAEGFEAAQRINPHHPSALVGLGRLVLLAENDYGRVDTLLQQALEVDPTYPEALRLKAELKLSDEDGAGARQALAPLLQRNPNDLQALALLAASHDLDDDLAARRAVEQRMRVIHPRPALLWDTLSRVAERAHRYPEAVEYARQALRTDPDHWPALRRLGTGLTRLGRVDEGRRALERYYEHDDYDVTVANTLNLFEEFLKEYRSLPGRPFVLRARRDEGVLLELFARPLLDDFHEKYRKSYGFTPRGPLTVELFHEPELFGIRSIGLPAVMSHGVSFGQLVTSRSPRTNDFNWAQVLSHELSHVFGLQLSRYRVPRWLTEGLAEYETNQARPEWNRHHSQQLYHALRSGRLLGVEQLNEGFTRAKSLGDVLVAYQQASLLVHFLCEQHGYAQVIELHRQLARDPDVVQALQATLGLAPAELDRRFRAWLEPRLSALDGVFTVDAAAYREGGPREQRLRDEPESADALAALAAHRLLRQPPGGDPDPVSAYSLAQQALQRAPTHPLALYVAGMASLKVKESQRARQLLGRLQESGRDGPEVARTLGELALAAGEPEEAARQLEAARRMDPEDAHTLRLRVRLAKEQGDREGWIEELAALSLLDQHDPGPALTVATRRLKQGNLAEAALYGRRALECGLFLPEVHELLARLELKQQRPGPALTHAFAASYLRLPPDEGQTGSRRDAGKPPGNTARPPDDPERGAGLRSKDRPGSLAWTVRQLKDRGQLAPAAAELTARLKPVSNLPAVAGLLATLRPAPGSSP